MMLAACAELRCVRTPVQLEGGSGALEAQRAYGWSGVGKTEKATDLPSFDELPFAVARCAVFNGLRGGLC